ncbi:MAG: hypothetical protein ACRD0C_11070 [Acidimicrobiia bacterium]
MSWLQVFGDDRDRAALDRVLERGVFAGLVAGAAMGVFAMAASATYQGRGFFTPMYHAAIIIDEQTMGVSIAKAGAGEPFYFFRETFIFGVIAYVMLGGMLGAAFAVGARQLRLRGPKVIAVGLAYALAVMVVMSFLVLPPAAELVGAGRPLSRMGAEVGWPTFVAQFAVFGLVLGGWAYKKPEHVGADRPRTTADPAVQS